MILWVVYVALAASVVTSFWSSLVEATYLTLHPVTLRQSASAGTPGAVRAMAIINEKTKLVSVTTFIDTFSNVVLASCMGLIFSSAFGPLGWVYSALLGSLVIMTLLFLLPKAIGIENSPRMAVALSSSCQTVMEVLSPIAVPLTSFARALSERIVGKPGYKNKDLADEFEDVVALLEQSGHIEPDAGRLLRTALSSSRTTAGDVATPMEKTIVVPGSATVFEALKLMGLTGHPRMPVYDEEKKIYIGAVTFRSVAKAIGRGLLEIPVTDYIVQPARVSRDETVTSVLEKMQEAATTIALVYDGDNALGILTLSDIIEQIMGIKV